MRTTRTSLAMAVVLVGLSLCGAALWGLHATAWDLGHRSPALNFETAQSAVAARELATRGRLATPFALPVELAAHPDPPWPLGMVEPGMVLSEAAVLRVLPNHRDAGGILRGPMARPDQQEEALLVIPMVAFLLLATSLALAARHLMVAGAAPASPGLTALAGLVVGLAFLLDPEAQHFAVGPFPQVPFALGLMLAVAGLALGRAWRQPLVFGLLIGLTAAFGTHLPWLAPIFTVAAAWSAPAGRRGRVAVRVLIGFAILMLPWGLYQWRAFGTPFHDLTRLELWNGIGGNTWFSLYHMPAIPELPRGLSAVSSLAAKIARNLPALVLATMTGPRALWVVALITWTLVGRAPRESRIAGATAIAIGGASLIGAAATIPLLRSVFAARVVTEAAGILACWGLIARAPEFGVSTRMQRATLVFVALLALGWGAWQTRLGLGEARTISFERGTPGALSLLQLGVMMRREIPPGEPVMSNLGPELAWQARRPVIHLALRPEFIAACRERTEFRNVLLVFRDADHAWPGWGDLVDHPVEASRDPALGIRRARQFRTGDGFVVAWLELAPPGPKLALVP